MSELPNLTHPTRPGVEPQDAVDVILQDWARERPDLDFSPVGIVTRLARVRSCLDQSLLRVFADYELTAADFEVIVTLRRSGAPYRLPQARLAEALGLTSGTVSVRIERLTKRGVVVRSDDPDDKRGLLVTLTATGLDLFDDIAPVHLHNEDRLLSALDPAERNQLAELLRRLLVSFEGSHQVDRLIGGHLEPAHLARARRSAVGLSDSAGLLVADVHPGGPADHAGLRRGDLLIEADGHSLHSEASLVRALGSGGSKPISITILRGDQRHRTMLSLPL